MTIKGAREECGDLINAVMKGSVGWDDVVSLKAALRHYRQHAKTGVPVFESQGIAMWDLVAANLAYSGCKEMDLGTKVNLRDLA